MATGPKKFGAFSGVFTPSILTILGVIMYLRLGWVAGVAGVTGIIAIILLAHVISFTTGLSISSIATDKKIKAGGIYYILSRSLGLPMGGSIGITLFVGTALSISLYIIGFTESFLSIPTIQGWTEAIGLSPDSLNTTRIIGTAVLIILVIIAFISTEIAIKTQFLILTAIALSLISIFVGFFTHSDLSPQMADIDYSPFKDFSFEVVFAVFFPAVTGFTAGVAMSGDLKDPKKDIPKGTMWAIIIGFIVYLILGVSFVLLVDKDLLLNDYNFLLKLAWIPALVIAGIWGATLSSALGGILGGPRILQAIANDHIVPKLLGKGYGVSNEPRNALIFTFILSELGILIGDLNIIAGIVTMFYLTAYGFINLAFALEKWASSDFRPSFHVPIWVGVIGFVASFMIMFKLDMVSMFAALIILGAIFYYINRKHFRRPMTSVWQSVHTSLVRNILNKLDKEKPDERNWRPNILLFSGGTKNRPHLIEFGKSLVANQGMISNFDLILNPSSKYLFPKHKQTLSDADTESNQGIFSRRQECNNIYQAIETIASIYGFSGVEPNTVLLGWGRNSSKPVQFVKMINRLVSLDLNVVLLDYDKKRGFGKYNLIDVWWRGGSNNGNFILSLIKFIHSTYEWRNARVRIMIVNPINQNKSWIERDARNVLANMRIDAEIRIINNEIDRRSIYDIIKQESINSDLVFLGIPDIVEGKEEEFIKATDKLCKNIGTTVLVKASSMFQELHIGFNPGLPKFETSPNATPPVLKVPELAKPVSSSTADEMGNYYKQVISIINKTLDHHLDPIFSMHNMLFSNIEKTWMTFYQALHKKIKDQDGDLRIFITNQNLQLVARTKKLTQHFRENDSLIIKEEITNLMSALSEVQENVQTTIPDEFVLKLTETEANELLKSGKLTPGEAALLESSREFTIPFSKIKEYVLLADLAPAWVEMLKELSYSNYVTGIKLSKLTDLIEEYQVGKHFLNVDNKQVIETLEMKEASFTNLMTELRESSKRSRETTRNTLLAGVTRSFNKSIALIETPEGWKRYPRKGIATRMKQAEKQVLQFEEIWIKNQQIISGARTISWELLAFKLRLRSLLIRDINLFNQYFAEYNEKILTNTKNQLEQLLTNGSNIKSQKLTVELIPDYEAKFQEILKCNEKIILNLLEAFPERIKLFSDDKFQDFKTHQFDMNEQVVIELNKLLVYILKNDLLQSLQNFYKSISEQIITDHQRVKQLAERVNHASIPGKNKEIEKAINILSEVIENNKSLTESTELRINERLNATWDKLSLSTISIQNEMLQSYIREELSSQRKNIVLNVINSIKTFYTKIISGIKGILGRRS
jgi:amino acid transporter